MIWRNSLLPCHLRLREPVRCAGQDAVVEQARDGWYQTHTVAYAQEQGRIGFLLKRFGSAKAVAAEIGVTPDSVNRYRCGARKRATSYNTLIRCPPGPSAAAP